MRRDLGEARAEFAEVRATTHAHTGQLVRIETQTTRTNGRVSELEDWREAHDHLVAVADARAAERKQVRAEDRAKLDALREFILDDPLKVGVVAAAAGLGGLVLGRWPL